MHEEEERKKHQEASIQRAIQNELDERQQKEAEQHEKSNIMTHFQAQRRRKLMAQKQAGMSDDRDDRNNTSCHRQPPQQDHSAPFHPDLLMTSRSQLSIDQHRCTIPNYPAVFKTTAFSNVARQRSELSSLMDEDSLEDDDLEDITLE